MLCSLHLKSTKRFWNTVSKTTATLVITPSREADQLSFKAFYRENPHLQCLWETGFSLRLFTNHEDTHFSCLSVGSLSGSIILGDKASGRFKVNSWGKWPYSKRIQCPSPARVGSQTGVEDRVIPLEGPWGREGSFWEVFGRRLTSRTRLGPPLLVPFCPHTSEDEKVKPLSSWEELTHFPPSPRLRGAEGVHGRNQGGSWGSQAKVWISCREGTSASSCENWSGGAQAGPWDWRASCYWWLHSCSCLFPNPGGAGGQAECSPAWLLSHALNSWLGGLRKVCMPSGLENSLLNLGAREGRVAQKSAINVYDS